MFALISIHVNVLGVIFITIVFNSYLHLLIEL